LDREDADSAAAQLQSALSRATPLVPPLMDPLVVVGPFGSGKRAVLQELARELLPGLIAAAPVITTRERAAGAQDGGATGMESFDLALFQLTSAAWLIVSLTRRC
jgi:xanthine/uracil/vitamin C permease (AzgA family)